MADDQADLVILLIDTNVFLGSRQRGRDDSGAAAKSLLEQVLYFVSAYLMINDSNRLAVFAVQEHTSDLLHLSLGDATLQDPDASNPTCNIGTKLARIITLLQAARRGPAPRPPALSGALSRALCLVHRLKAKQGRGGSAVPALAGAPIIAAQCRPRILCLVGSPDVSVQYIPVMNAIFSAQRAEVAVDALMLGPPGLESAFLQQAAHLTGGLYLRAPQGSCSPNAPAAAAAAAAAAPEAPGSSSGGRGGGAGAALQYLLSCLSVDTETRRMLRVHQPLGVDFRASCFCHKRAVDVGHVCSVCLSIFCRQLKECAICGTGFGEGGADGALLARLR